MAAYRAQRETLGHDEAAAFAATIEPQLISSGERGREEDRVLEGDLRSREQLPESLEGLAEKLAAPEPGKRHASRWHCAGRRGRRCARRHDAEQCQHAREHGTLVLKPCGPREIGDLVWRLAPMARQVASRMIHVGPVELANAIIGEARPGADGPSAGLVAQEAQRQLHARALLAVAIVGDAHGSLRLLLVHRGGIGAILGKIHQKTQLVNLVENHQICRMAWRAGSATILP